MNLKRQLELTNNTPNCVILSAFKCINMIISIETLNSKKQKRIEFYNKHSCYFELKEEYDKKDLEIIASYTSYDDVNWTKQSLLDAFHHILEFEKDISGHADKIVSIGPKNNMNIHNYDVIMLYQVCQALKIDTDKDTTLDDMNQLIKEYMSKTEQDLYSEIASKLASYSINELIDVNRNLVKKERSTTELKNVVDTDLLSRTIMTNEEAIVYAAKYFWYDVSESQSPYDELIHIKYCKDNDKCYKPIDIHFLENYTKNKYYYQLDYFWKPKFKEYYTSKCMTNLLKHESIEIEDAVLQLQYLNDVVNNKNFYIGVIPHHHKDETYVYKNPLNFNDTLITYGTYTDNVVISITELNDFFTNHNDFMELMGCDSTLDKRLIKKLIRFCRQNPLENDCKQLLTTIQMIEKNKEIIDDTISTFVNLYKIENEKIDDFLNQVFELSMYMRGWKVNGNDTLPLNKHICNENSFYTEKIEDNINDSIRKLFDFVKNSEPHIKNSIEKLPLIKLHETEKTFYRNTNSDEGLTLLNRLQIIMNNNSVYSCIRMSSNFIASTYYYYDTIVLKNSKKFDLNEMDFIR